MQRKVENINYKANNQKQWLWLDDKHNKEQNKLCILSYFPEFNQHTIITYSAKK